MLSLYQSHRILLIRGTLWQKKRRPDQLTQLGSRNTKYTYDYDPNLLEKIPNKHGDRDYFIKFNCPEFTSLCPKTGQPDFATIYISYIPDKWMVESKSLKLYLFSYRNHGDFHEDCVNMIMTDLIHLLHPRYIEVCGKFLPAAAFLLIPTAITASPVRNGKISPATVFFTMT